MGSIVRTGGSNIDRSADLRGLSTDVKPTRAQGDNVPHGSTWYNMDDCTKYMYNADNDTWYNIPNGGGGTGDMQKSVYDPTNAVANAGGIDTYVGDEIDDAKSEIITEIEGNIAPIANNLINDTVGWTNKNLLPITLDQLKAINTSGTWEDNVYTYNGITITVDIFNNLITGINVNGANTAGNIVFKLTDNFVYQLLSEDKYYISDGVDITTIVDGSAYISVERKKGESGESDYLSTNNEERSTEFTVDYSVYDYYFVNIYIPNNSSINNAVFYPMIRRASISDDTYEPYTETVKDEIFNLNSAVGNLASRVGIAEGNITTLNEIKANKSDLGTASTKNSTSVVTDSSDLVESGAVKDIVGWGNKNLLDPTTLGLYDATGASAYRYGFAPITLKAGTYTFSYGSLDTSVNAYITNITNNYAQLSVPSDTKVLTFTLNVDSLIFVRTSASQATTVTNAQLEKGSTATAYEPYHASVEDTLRDAEVIEGKNLVDYTLFGCNIDSTGGIADDGLYTSAVAKVKKGETYAITTDDGKIVYGFFTSKPVPSSRTYNNQRVVTNVIYFTAPIDGYVAFRTSLNYTTPQLEVGTQATAFEPYYVPLKDVVPNKCDNSVIAPVENGTTASQDYAVGDYFIKNTILGKTKIAIARGGTFTKDMNYEETDVAKEMTELYKYIGILTTPISAVVANNLQPRFKDITSDFYLGTLRAEIAAGDFSNIRVGDYIIGQTTGSKYYVACLDWMFNKGDQTNATYQAQAYGQHHLGLMLFKPVGTTSLWLGKGDAGGSWQVSANDKGRCPWNAATDVDPTSTSAVGSNDTNITRSYNGSNVSGYMGSFIRERMDAILLPQCFQADFGSSNVLMFRNLNGNAVITDKPSGGQGNWNGCTSGWTWYDRYLDLPSEVEIYGSRIFGSAYDIGVQCERLPMFKNADINAYFPRLDLWTKAVASSSIAANRNGYGSASGSYASAAIWACPLACVR